MHIKVFLNISLIIYFLTLQTHANECAHFFRKGQKNFQATHSSEIQKTFDSNRLELIKNKFSKLKSIDEKMSLIENEYKSIRLAYKEDENLITAKINIQAKDIPPQMLQLTKKGELALLDIKYQPFVDLIVEETHKIITLKNIPIEMITKEMPSGIKYQALALPDSFQSSLESLSKISRYKERFGTKLVTFDYFENLKKGSGGFSQQSTKRIDLGFKGVKSIIQHDLITMIGKHEFTHASYIAKRNLDETPSIYMHSYFGSSTKALGDKVYTQYMSAEELYTFGNNMFWASDKLMHMERYLLKDILDDMNDIASYMRMQLDVSKQSYEISQHFMDELTRAAQSLKTTTNLPEKVYFDYLNSSYRQISSHQELTHISFYDEFGRKVVFHVDRNMSPITEQLTKIRETQLLKANERLKHNPFVEDPIMQKKWMEEATKDLVKEEVLLTRELQIELIEMLQKDLHTFHKVSDNLIQEGAVLNEKTKRFFSEFKKEAQKLGDEITRDPYWNKRIKELVQEYREIGNKVKESYKGFAGQ